MNRGPATSSSPDTAIPLQYYLGYSGDTPPTPANVGDRFFARDTSAVQIYAGIGPGWLLDTTFYDGAIFPMPPSGTASNDVAALNSSLSGGGLVIWNRPGTYLLNQALVAVSNTRLVISPGVKFQAVKGGPGGNAMFTLLQNANCNSTPVNITSMSGSIFNGRSIIMTIGFGAPHGLAAGQYVQIKNDPFDVYNGIWHIDSAPNPTTLTIKQNCAGSTVTPPVFSTAGQASASQTVANPGVFTAAGNTLVAGQAVTITGTPPGGLSTGTVYYVVNVSQNGGGGTFSLSLSPYGAGIQITSSSACTLNPVPALGAAADANITIEGGRALFDSQYSAAGFANANSPQDNPFAFRRVLNLSFDRITVRDGGQGHCPLIQDCENPIISNMHMEGPTFGDGPHIFGRTVNPLVENITGTSADDGAVMQCVDTSAFTNLMYGSGLDLGGDIVNPTFRNIRLRHNGNTGAVAIYPNGNTGAAGATNGIWRFRGKVLIDFPATQDPTTNNGTNWNSGVVGVGNSFCPAACPIDSLELRNPYGKCTINNLGSPILNIGQVIYSGPTSDKVFGDNSQLVLDWCNIGSVVVNYGNYAPTLSGTGVAQVYLNSANCTVGSITFNACSSQVTNPSLTAPMLSSNGATVSGGITFNGCTLGTLADFIESATFSGPVNIVINGGSGNGCKALVVAGTNNQSFNITINGFSLVSPTQGLFNFFGSAGGATATYTFNVTGLNFSGTMFANMTGGSFVVNNPDGTMPVDITKIARNAGSVAKHNGATNATPSGTAGTAIGTHTLLAICDDTGTSGSWNAMRAGAFFTF